MNKFLKTLGLVVFSVVCLASSTLSAWYDPTGYWGRHYQRCFNLPSSGKYTLRWELFLLRAHTDNLRINDDVIANAPIFQNPPGLIINFTNDERKRRFKWRYGWKLGFGYACGDCWEADVNWTHYQGKGLLSDFGGAESKWKSQIDLFDLEIGREMWFHRSFRLKPYYGLRVAQIKQRWKFEVEGTIIYPIIIPGAPIPIFPVAEFELNGVYRNNYLAVGPRVGVDASWGVGCGFHLYVTGAASYLFGETENRYKDSFVVDGIDKDHHWDGAGITDLGCGIGWSDLWWNERRRLTFRFGYEHHFFIHQLKLNTEGAVRRAKNNWFIQGVGGTITVDF